MGPPKYKKDDSEEAEQETCKTACSGKREEGGSPRRGQIKFDMCHEPINDARYRLAHVLRGRDDQTASQKQDRGEDVVQPEYSIIRLNVLELEVILKSSQQLIHLGTVLY